jgi:hypothetical protein
MNTSTATATDADPPSGDDLLGAAATLDLLGLSRTSRSHLITLHLKGELVPVASTSVGKVYRRSDVEALAAKRAAS